VIVVQRIRQLASLAAVIVLGLLFWNFLTHVVFALFPGTKIMTRISSAVEVFLSAEGLGHAGLWQADKRSLCLTTL
jgi:hypothetical protein